MNTNIFNASLSYKLERRLNFFESFDNIVSYNKFNNKRIETCDDNLKKISITVEFIEKSYLINPSISQLSKVACISKYHFLRLFKHALGTTPYQFTMEKRLHYAAKLLQNTTLQISNVAMECGFNDVFTFSKAFKRKYKIPPSEFYKNNQRTSLSYL